MSTLQTANANIYTWHGGIPDRQGMVSLGGGRHLFECADGKWISFTIPVGEGPFFGFFLDWLRDEASTHELTDGMARSGIPRAGARRRSWPRSRALCAKHDREALFHEGQRRRLLLMPVNDVEDLVARPAAAVARLLHGHRAPGARAHARDAGRRVPAQRHAGRHPTAAPGLGEHTDEVLGSLLGVDGDERADCAGGRAVSTEPSRAGDRSRSRASAWPTSSG